MPRTTIYCVQTYWKDRLRLNMGGLRQFRKEIEARASGERASRRHDGVIVYALSGDPECEFWEEPRVLAAYGETPLSAM